MRNVFCRLLAAVLILGGCSTPPASTPAAPGLDDPGAKRLRILLTPKAKAYTGKNPPVIAHLLKGSVAERSQFKIGDTIVKFNGESVFTAHDLEQKIKKAPQKSEIVIKRGGGTKTVTVLLASERPRFGAGFEPEGVALVKPNSPFVGYMHKHDITVYAETSTNDEQTDLHLNLILESVSLIPVAHIHFAIFENTKPRPLGEGDQVIDALGGDPRVISKAAHQTFPLKGPIVVRVSVDQNQFVFEFQ